MQYATSHPAQAARLPDTAGAAYYAHREWGIREFVVVTCPDPDRLSRSEPHATRDCRLSGFWALRELLGMRKNAACGHSLGRTRLAAPYHTAPTRRSSHPTGAGRGRFCSGGVLSVRARCPSLLTHVPAHPILPPPPHYLQAEPRCNRRRNVRAWWAGLDAFGAPTGTRWFVADRSRDGRLLNGLALRRRATGPYERPKLHGRQWFELSTRVAGR